MSMPHTSNAAPLSGAHQVSLSPEGDVVSNESPIKHTIGTTTDAAPATSNAATQSIVHFNYRGWFPPEDELGSTEGSGGTGTSGSVSSSPVGVGEWAQQDSMYPQNASASEQDFVLTEEESGAEEGSGSGASSEGFSLATSPTPDNGEGPLKHKNSSSLEPHGPLPVAATIDTPQLNSQGRVEAEQPMDGNGMLWRPLQSEPQVSLRNLGDEIKTFVDSNLNLTLDEVAQRDRFISMLRVILRETISTECKLKVHGSFVTKLALRESDIDFLVTDYSPMQPIAAIDKMTLALLQFTNDDTATKATAAADVSVFNRAAGPSPSPGTYVPRHEGEVFTVQAIVFTRVPIIKITEKATGIKGDLSFGGGHHDESMRLTRKLLTRFPTARPLLLFLKNILKDGQMGESASGGLSSFALYLLVMHFYNIRFHCDGRMWEPTRTAADTAEMGSALSSAAATPVEGTAPSKFVSSGSTLASPAGASSAVSALNGTRLANVGSRIEEFLSGTANTTRPSTDLPTAGQEPDGLTATSTPVPQSIAGDSDVPVDCEEENDPRTLGEVFCLFCWYYSEFEIQAKGIVFDEEGNSFVVPKPDSLRGKATLHMTSPFDSGYDITARMTCIQAFQQLLFLVTVIITAGAKEHSLSLTTLHSQIRECFVDYAEPFDDTAYRIYSKSSQLLAGPYPQRGRGQGSRHHNSHKGHGTHGTSSNNQHHQQQFTYFHSQGSYAQQYNHQHHQQGFVHPNAMPQSSQIPLNGPHHTHHHFHRDPAAGTAGGNASQNTQGPILGNAERRPSEGRNSTPPPRHARGDSNVGVAHHQLDNRMADAATAAGNQTIPRTATVTTQTSSSAPHHGGFMPDQTVYQGFFSPYGPFPHQNPMGYPQYYGGYPNYGGGQYMGGGGQQVPGPSQGNTTGPGGSPSSLPVAPTTSFPKMKRGLGKSMPFEHPNPVHSHEPVGASNGMASFPNRGRGGGVKGPSRPSPPTNPVNHNMPMPLMHQGYYPSSGKVEQIMVLPPPQMMVPQPQQQQMQPLAAAQQAHKGRPKKGPNDQAIYSTPTVSAASEPSAPSLSLSPAPVARYVPPCRKTKLKGDVDAAN